MSDINIPYMLSKLPSNKWENGKWFYDPYEIMRAFLTLLQEPCTEHPWPEIVPPECKDHKPMFSQHRHDCPHCMSEIEKEIGK